MGRGIVVFGHHKTGEHGLTDEETVKRWIGGGVITDEHRRYRHKLKNWDPDIVIISWEGTMDGHFVIDHIEEPTPEEKDYNRVYIVRSWALYGNPVKLSDRGISGIKSGKTVTEQKFDEIQKHAGDVEQGSWECWLDPLPPLL